jgi:hypothetical protein
VSGFGHDTETLRLTVTLPDGATVRIKGANDGVNGFEWSAMYDRHVGEDVHLSVDVDHEVLIDGITPADDEPYGQKEPCPVCDAFGEHQSCIDKDGNLIDDHAERE